MPQKTKSYDDAGVSIENGDALVAWLQQQSEQKTQRARNLLAGIGGFASLYRLPLNEYQKPVLVTCTDGVGTKVKLAVQANRFQEVAQDCVAMCVNDLICSGADPHVFLDYFATGSLRLPVAQEFLQGIRKACEDSNCLLVGGETAEMPGVYAPEDFDCAGFAVGLVDEDQILGPQRVKVNDQVIGISSSGFHSNGFSLLRVLFAKDLEKWMDELLKPTALYVRLFQKLKAQKINLHAMAHITGGGIENVGRVLPAHVSWERKSWIWPENFQEVQKRSGLSEEQMLQTFNCGIGLVVILPQGQMQAVKTIAKEFGHEAFDLGQIVERPRA